MDDHRDYFLENNDDTTTPVEPDAASASEQTPVSPSPRKKFSRRIIGYAIAIIILSLYGFIYFRYFNPYATDAIATGYITSVERRGLLFKTFEGEMVTERSFGDTTRVYRSDFSFSIPDTTVARQLQQFQDSGQPVSVSFSRYYGSLPWRGASTCVVTSFSRKHAGDIDN